jgi:hypothetical protein
MILENNNDMKKANKTYTELIIEKTQVDPSRYNKMDKFAARI